MNLEECISYESAHEQRKNELARGLTKEGTKGYERKGCFDCNGMNKSCKSYIPKYIIEKLNNYSF